MKKVLLILLIVSLVLSLTACASNSKEDKNNNSANATESISSSSEKENTSNDEPITLDQDDFTVNENGDIVLSVGGMTIEVPSQTTSEQSTEAAVDIYSSDESLTGNSFFKGRTQIDYTEIYYDIPKASFMGVADSEFYSAAYTDLLGEGRHIAVVADLNNPASSPKEAMKAIYLDSFLNTIGTNSINRPDVTVKELTINNINVYMIEDTAGSNYFKAYAFVDSNNMPCVIGGCLKNKTQNKEDIQYISEVVDAMMSSVTIGSPT